MRPSFPRTQAEPNKQAELDVRNADKPSLLIDHSPVDSTTGIGFSCPAGAFNAMHDVSMAPNLYVSRLWG